ncbi:DUF2892 domain-containing protein [Halorussus salilacus]|uniref:YgaP family membrane protein n=1 Tax=Halorussus salilacus TaxID=2953750 RepID=UPI0020A1CB2D|nr:DUF2892 domain-containing protein [Halorussus salilacus]USZ67861.1 DUF2892 domain-containing protein [Halorussus salilacus]
MKPNVGGSDEEFRVSVGPLLLLVAAASNRGLIRLHPALEAAAAAVGAILTVTGLTRRCPANTALGRDTSDSGLSEEARTARERAVQ